ncbi:MAG TPA: HAD family hydrolase [Alphaproteobacteria bacterium]|jgi:HAD superfamily hydrolase (TIGR01549 family)|nr:HAD family hydrolase [Alphaproteobacteria bacterium]
MTFRPPAAAIFDVDGTLIDSVDFHAQAWAEAFAEFGVTAPFEKVRRQIGKGGDKLMPVFLSPAQLKDFGEELDAFRGGHFKRKYLAQLRPFAGVRALFERLTADGIRIALASSAKPDELEVYKRIAQIEDLLDAQTSAEDAAETKPAPDIFHAALRQLPSVPKDRILVFGDTPYDALAAGKAGLRSIGVLCGGFPRSSLSRAGCLAVYRSPSNILVQYEAVFRTMNDKR